MAEAASVAANAEELLLAPGKVKDVADAEKATPDAAPAVKALVVDTNALIKRVRLDGLAQQLYTVPGVMVRASRLPVAAGRRSAHSPTRLAPNAG